MLLALFRGGGNSMQLQKPPSSTQLISSILRLFGHFCDFPSRWSHYYTTHVEKQKMPVYFHFEDSVCLIYMNVQSVKCIATDID